jgi:YVTN family beta-propeller protein
MAQKPKSSSEPAGAAPVDFPLIRADGAPMDRHCCRLLLLVHVLVLAGANALAAPESGAAAASGWLLVCNKGDQTLGIIDPEQGRMVAAIQEEGVTGHEVAASPDGRRAYVPIYGNSGVGHAGTDGQLMRVIDLSSRRIVGTVDFGKGVRPHCVVVGPRDGRIYVTTELDNSITVVDPETLKVIGTIPTDQPESHMLAISRDGRRGYTSNVGPGTVSVLNLEAKKVIAVIPVSGNAQRICLSVDDRWVFTADQTRPRLAVISTTSNQVDRWIDLPSRGYSTAITPDGVSLLVTLPGLSQAGVVDLKTMKLARTIELPKTPQEILVRPDGAVAYVSCDASRQVAVIDVRQWIVTRRIDAGPGADGLAWAAAPAQTAKR